MIAADLGPLAGQRAGLVEEDGVDLVHQLERAAVLDQDALVGTEASELSIASGAAMRMPVPKSLLSTATAPAGPIVARPTAPRASVGITALSASRSPLCCEESL